MTNENWQEDFSKGLTILKVEIGSLTPDALKGDTNNLLEWASSTTKSVSKVSSICNGTQVALLLTDKLNYIGAEKQLEDLTDEVRRHVQVPEINTSSKRYKAAVALSCFLEEKTI